jgi:hypothetical protein
MPVARRRGDAAGLAGREASRVTSGCTASSRSRSSASSLTSSSCRRRSRLADRTSCCRPGRTRANEAWAGTRVSTPNSSAPHAPRSRNRARTRPANRRYPAAEPGVRRSGSRGSAIRKIIGWSPALRGRWEPRWVNAISSRSPAPVAAGYRCRYPPESRQLRYFHAVLRCPWLGPALRSASQGGQFVAVGTEVPGFGVADVRACCLRERVKEAYRCVSVVLLSCAVAGVLARAITSRSW